ncbi:MAG: hypothetical protein ACT4PZ_05635 [Panacagrimonas sp.]
MWRCLARKPVFLHDDPVKSLDSLFDPARGPKAPHPFYLSDAARRADMTVFLLYCDDDGTLACRDSGNGSCAA